MLFHFSFNPRLDARSKEICHLLTYNEDVKLKYSQLLTYNEDVKLKYRQLMTLQWGREAEISSTDDLQWGREAEISSTADLQWGRKAEIRHLMTYNEDVKLKYSQLVPDVTCHYDFFKNYFYQVSNFIFPDGQCPTDD